MTQNADYVAGGIPCYPPEVDDQTTLDPLTRKLLSTSDAMVWAEEFVRTFYGRTIASQCDVADGVDEGTMVGWFANAMCVAERDAYERGWREANDRLACEDSSTLIDGSDA
jgi:hypothetical protein